MNLPNRLSLLRICLVPVYLFALAWDSSGRFWAFGVFALAAITDLLDGHVARTCGMTTRMGKFLDPIADKLLVGSALIWLTAAGVVEPWLVIVIIAREFLVSGLRLVAASQGHVLPAGKSGKVKTVFQMGFVLAATLFETNTMPLRILGWITGALTVWSAMHYFWTSRHLLQEGEPA